MSKIRYFVFNYIDENRIYTESGVAMKHLGTIIIGSRKFVIYEVNDPKTAEPLRFIEELISTKFGSDLLFGADQLIKIEDEKLWLQLMKIATKEGILTPTS